MKIETLLAKSYKADETNGVIPEYAKLFVHLKAVEAAGRMLVETIGKKVLQQLNLNEDVWLPRLQRGLRTACLAHDIGKANQHFQEMVRGIRSPKIQSVRHELLSALMLINETGEVRRWALNLISENNNEDDVEMLLECIIGAVAGHHLKLDEEWQRASIALRDGGCGADLQILLNHPDLIKCFGDVTIKDFCIDLTDNPENSLKNEHTSFKFDSSRFIKKLSRNVEWWRFAAALKALMMAADVAGSALVSGETKVSPRKWIAENLAENRFITSKQMHEVVDARLKGKELRPFQQAVAKSTARVTLVEAGCGTGKTAAAYAWAANNAVGRKLFFCYPTTGTATEGFRDYVAIPESSVEAELMHSRALVDLEGMATVKGDDENNDESLLRIESLKAWSPQVIVCTADTVLALPRNNRRGLYSSPAILTASFVFDELHAYDSRMFEAVIALIKALPGAKFLLMTASLPASRREYLQKQIGENDLSLIPTPRELEDLPRYKFEQLPKEANEKGINVFARQIAADAARENKKVLWICNTVSRAQAVFAQLEKDELPVVAYHSRFKYEDRVRKHRQVIAGFDRKTSAEALIAVTTQVAEMSLDLDADVLICEIAHIPALIQRLGRLNRRITIECPGTPRTAYFYRAEDHSPYKSEEIVAGEKWIEKLKGQARPISQSDLSQSFQEIVDDEKLNLKLSVGWLDSGWFAVPEQIRDDNVNSVSVILPKDEKDCRQSVEVLIKRVIPMNYSSRMKDWQEYKGNLIAPPGVIDYCEERGARWAD